MATLVRLQRSVHEITVLRRESIIHEAVGADAGTAKKLLGGGGAAVQGKCSSVTIITRPI